MEQPVVHRLGRAIGVGLLVVLTLVACSGTTTQVSAPAAAKAPTDSLTAPSTTSGSLATALATAPPNSSAPTTGPTTTTVPTTAAPTRVAAQPADPVAATAAIRDAYATLINAKATPSQLNDSVQGMANPGGLKTWQQAKNLMTGAGVVVYSVQFTSALAAKTVFQFFYNGGLSPIFPKPLDGGAVYEGGHWRIDTATACSLAVVAGYPCPGRSAQPPTTDAVPPGVVVPTTPPNTGAVPSQGSPVTTVSSSMDTAPTTSLAS